MFKHTSIADIENLQSRISAKTTKNGRVYVIDGTEYSFPSITTVLGRIPNPGLWEWKKRVGEAEANRIARQATTKGTKVHACIESLVNNEDVALDELMPDTASSVNGIKLILEENLHEVYASEVALFSRYLQVAGRVDLIGRWKNAPAIIDFKTSRRHKTLADIPNYFIQAAAYAIMFEEITTIPIPQLVIIMAVNGDPKPLVFEQKRSKWDAQTVETIETYR